MKFRPIPERMMPQFSKAFLDEVRARIPVSSVVGRAVKLVRRGREFVGLSPFSHEKSPSFTVNDEKGFYHCFSTHEHGDIFGFLMKTANMSFRESVECLAAEAGLLGMSGDVEYKPTVQVKKTCKDCRWLWRRYPKEIADPRPGFLPYKITGHRYFCGRVVDFSFKEPVPLAFARHPGGECGTYGKLHEVAP